MPKDEVIALRGQMPSPRRPEELEEIFRPHATALGWVLYSWNWLHESLGALFEAVVRAGHGPVARAIWQSSNSDRAQRAMLLAASVAAQSHTLTKPQGEDIKWLYDMCDKLAQARNDAIHAPMFFSTSHEGTAVIPHDHQGNKRAKGLASRNLLNEFRWCRETASVLTDFSYRAAASLNHAERIPWPDRPPMPNRGVHR